MIYLVYLFGGVFLALPGSSSLRSRWVGGHRVFYVVPTAAVCGQHRFVHRAQVSRLEPSAPWGREPALPGGGSDGSQRRPTFARCSYCHVDLCHVDLCLADPWLIHVS